MTTPSPRTGRLIMIAVIVVLASATGATGTLAASGADDPALPSARQVEEARDAVTDRARTVVAVRADLALAGQRLQTTSITAARAAEAFNTARWQLSVARRASRQAERTLTLADDAVGRQRTAYESTLSATYMLSPELTALSAIVRSDGISTVVDRATTLGNAEEALDQQYEDFRDAAGVAGVAAEQASTARSAAEELHAQTRAARSAAAAAEAAAVADVAAITADRDALVQELAELQGTSVALAARRQTQLEHRAEERRRRREERRRQAEPPTPVPAPTATPTAAPTPAPAPTLTATPSTTPTPTTAPTTVAPAPQPEPPSTPPPTPSAEPTPTPTPTPTPPLPPAPPVPPAPSSGAAAAVAFATEQLGDPYQWGASGPDSWDCSGLTSKAWAAGGLALPHSSVGQYAASTPIDASVLQPGDLLFWGSTPGSIHHVALYAGGDQMIHAPRTGRPVVRESIYYWTTPDFYARP